MMKTLPKRQEGMVLVTCLVILVLLTLLGVTALHLGFGNLQVVSNMQHTSENLAAAQDTIEKAISTTRFTTNPTAVFQDSTTGNYTNTRNVDVNGDGTPDVKVVLQKPVCLKVSPVTQYNLSSADDQACASGQSSKNFGTVSSGGGTAGGGTCSDTLWEVDAQASEINNPNASVTLAEGVSMRIQQDTAQTSCP